MKNCWGERELELKPNVIRGTITGATVGLMVSLALYIVSQDNEVGSYDAILAFVFMPLFSSWGLAFPLNHLYNESGDNDWVPTPMAFVVVGFLIAFIPLFGLSIGGGSIIQSVIISIPFAITYFLAIDWWF